jgi:hypothetical protein
LKSKTHEGEAIKHIWTIAQPYHKQPVDNELVSDGGLKLKTFIKNRPNCPNEVYTFWRAGSVMFLCQSETSGLKRESLKAAHFGFTKRISAIFTANWHPSLPLGPRQ